LKELRNKAQEDQVKLKNPVDSQQVIDGDFEALVNKADIT